MSASNTVTADLIYFKAPPDGTKPYHSINIDPKTGVRDQNWIKEPPHVQIENVRGKEADYSLDTSGFLYSRNAQKYTSFADDEEIAREYYPESIELVKSITGASRIVPFDHSMYHCSTIDGADKDQYSYSSSSSRPD